MLDTFKFKFKGGSELLLIEITSDQIPSDQIFSDQITSDQIPSDKITSDQITSTVFFVCIERVGLLYQTKSNQKK